MTFEVKKEMTSPPSESQKVLWVFSTIQHIKTLVKNNFPCFPVPDLDEITVSSFHQATSVLKLRWMLTFLFIIHEHNQDLKSINRTHLTQKYRKGLEK